MELHHLRDFVAVAEELSFTRAAVKLHLAQPSLSRQIKNLEEELGVQLLLRENGKVSLTEEGRAFLPGARRVLSLSAENVEAVRQLHRNETAQLRIGYASNLYYRSLPATLNALRASHPYLEVKLFKMTCGEQMKALDESRIDIGFVGLRECVTAENVQVQCVARYEALIALPKANPLARLAKVDVRKLQPLLFVVLSEDVCPGLHNWMHRMLSDAGLRPAVLQKLESESAILNSVADGLGVALVSEQTKMLPHDGVVLRPPRPALKLELCIAWKIENSSRPLKDYIQIVDGCSLFE
jgi:LysR family transcriptional regulator, benzoate and cis,cis-muconate-responsive activator of ben and cat genes